MAMAAIRSNSSSVRSRNSGKSRRSGSNCDMPITSMAQDMGENTPAGGARFFLSQPSSLSLYPNGLRESVTNFIRVFRIGVEGVESGEGGVFLLNFHQSPFLVIWEVTRACALKCLHCR